MENNVFLAFLVMTFIVGFTLGIAIYGVPQQITGKTFWDIFGDSDTSDVNAPGISCDDSDGGINLAAKGYCLDSLGDHADLCISATDIVEYWCTDVSCVSKLYNCLDYGYTACQDGACVGYAEMPSPSIPETEDIGAMPSPITSSIIKANLRQLKPYEFFNYAKAGKKLIMQDLPPISTGDYEYTVYIKNNEQPFLLIAVIPPWNFIFVICGIDECTNPYTFTSPFESFDIIYMPAPTDNECAAMIQGAHAGDIIEIDYNDAKEISVPNNESYFINASVDLPPEGSVALFNVEDFSGFRTINGWIYLYGIAPLRLHAKDTISKDYNVELGLSGTRKTGELSARLLFTSVMFDYPFQEPVNIPWGYTERNFEAYRAVTNRIVNNYSVAPHMIATNEWTTCYFPTNTENNNCLSYNHNKEWVVGEKISWNALTGNLTPSFENNYIYTMDAWDGAEEFHTDIFAPLENITSYTRQLPPYRLGLGLLWPVPHIGQGVNIYATDAHRNKMEIYGGFELETGFFNATTPTGREVYGNYFPWYLSCGDNQGDLLGPCENGIYSFYFDSTGVFLDSRQKPCLRAKALYKFTKFIILEQQPGVMINGQCVPEHAAVTPL